jgi:hypothetical protein
MKMDSHWTSVLPTVAAILFAIGVSQAQSTHPRSAATSKGNAKPLPLEREQGKLRIRDKKVTSLPTHEMHLLIAQMGHLMAELHDSETNRDAARAWFVLNEAADRLAEQLNKECGANSAFGQKCLLMANEAGAIGLPLFWCDPDARWLARPLGYLASSQLFSDSTQTEEAWWRGRLRHSDCRDEEGATREEAQSLVKTYTEFLRRFPHGKHSAEAQESLKAYEAEIVGYK